MKDKIFRKCLLLGIIILFFGAGIIQCIGGSKFSNILKFEKEPIYQEDSYLETLTFYPTDDAFIKHSKPNANYGDFAELHVCNDYGGGGSSGFAQDSLIRFDISSISSESIIVSAMLNLYYFKWIDTQPNGRTIRAYRAKDNWNEDTVTWNNQPEYELQMSAYAQIPVYYGWTTWDLTEEVQEFVNDEKSNYGWKITDKTFWGDYDIPVSYFYSKENEKSSPYLEIDLNDAPQGPFIVGPTTGSPGIEYEYSFYAFDPEGHDVYFWIKWGDDTQEYWIGPYESGEQVTLNHTWNEENNYIITTIAKDIYNFETDWQFFEVIIPRHRLLTNPILSRFFNQFPLLQRLLDFIK